MPTLRLPHIPILEVLETFQTQVGEATQFLYIAHAIDELAARNQEVLQLLNDTPHFWLTIKVGLQNSAILTVGKIFDQASDAHSIHKLLKYVYENRQTVFSKTALAQRKKQMAPEIADVLAEYMRGVHEFKQSDIQRVSCLLKKYRRIYFEQFHDIRTNLIAHTLVVDPAEIAALYAKTNRRELEKCVRFLNQLSNALWHLYYNGTLPRIRPMRHSTVVLVAMPLKRLRRGSTQENIVRETRHCLNTLLAGRRVARERQR
jgi:hypothetical protein